MPKAILSNRIYLDVDSEQAKKLQQELTYRIKKPPRPGMTHFSLYDIVKSYKMISSKVMSIPIGRTDLIPEGYEIVDKRISEEYPFPDPKFDLYPEQREVYDQVKGAFFLNAKVGWGKTFTALHIARKLGMKTLVVCHTTVLRDQWIEEAEELFAMPVGQIGSGIFDIDHSLVIGNIQTLVKVLPDIAKEFGTVILDEAHHCPASTFGAFLDGMYAKYKCGLSGTMKRKDGKQVLFKDYFGNEIFQPAESNTLTPKVRIVNSGVATSQGDAWAEKINKLLYDFDYQQFIAAMAKMYIAKGYRVLVVADRVEFLTNVGALIGEDCVCIIGETSREERKEIKRQINSGEKAAVAGSRQIISEGWSVNALSCVILAGPISAPSYGDGLLEQIIGRVQRKHPGKRDPLVIDINFCGPSDRKQNKERKEFYQRQGWEVYS